MPKFNLNWLYAVIIIGLLSVYILNNGDAALKKIDFTEFKDYVAKGYVSKVIAYNDNTVDVFIKPEYAREVFKQNAEKALRNPVVTMQIGSVATLDAYLDECEKSTNVPRITRDYGEKKDYMTALFWNLLPFILIIFFWVFMMRRMGNSASGGGGVFNVGRSKAQLVEKSSINRITFKDVAGQAEAKQEVKEIVDFLKHPDKYTELGGKIPKGALLVGPPGTGKTLLAKAVAGEASVPFFSLSGSDFVEMFVGVGASRVRDLFRQAKEKAPCIIFIDEMDGFGTNSGIIILAATNRADILDKALLRAGRFDRQIHVDLPDLNERKEVFAVHLRPIKTDKTVDVDLLARQTPGFSGADIANVCNEAALIAARHKKESVGKQDFLDAVDRIVGGLEKKTKVMTQEEKHTIALHEAGHATLSWFLEHANPLIKVTIVPRGRALGAAWYLPEERQITTKEQMLDEMCATLGGRAAEELFVGKISTGAMNDLERVTKQSYGMIAYAGMSDKLPNLCYYNMDDNYFTKPYSDSTAQLIDSEVKRMIQEQYDRAKAILKEHQEGHNKLAQLLMEREVIFAEDVEQIFGKRPWASRSEEILANDDAKTSDTKAKQEPTAENAEQANVTEDEVLANAAEKSGELKTDDEKATEKKSVAEPTLFDETTDGEKAEDKAAESKPAEPTIFDEDAEGGDNVPGEETNAADKNVSDTEADEKSSAAPTANTNEESGLTDEGNVTDGSSAAKVPEEGVDESYASEEVAGNKSADEVKVEESSSEPADPADTESTGAALFSSKTEEDTTTASTEEVVASEKPAEEKTDEVEKSTDAASAGPSLFDVETGAEKTDETAMSTDAASAEPSLFDESAEDLNDSEAEETKASEPKVIEAYTPEPFVLPHWTAWPEDDESKDNANEAKRPADLWKQSDTTKSSDNAKSADDTNVRVTVTENSIEWKFPEENAAVEGSAEESDEATSGEAETTNMNASEPFTDEVTADEAFWEVITEQETNLTDEESAEDNILWNGTLFEGTDEKDEDEARFAEMAEAMEEEANVPEQTEEAFGANVTEENEIITEAKVPEQAEETAEATNLADEETNNAEESSEIASDKSSYNESAEEPLQGTIDFGTYETKPTDETKDADEKPTEAKPAEVKSADLQTTIDWGFFEDEMSNETADTTEKASTENPTAEATNTTTAPVKSSEEDAEKSVNQKIADGEAVQVNE